MSKEIGIGKVEINIGDKTIPLTLEQARELKDALEQLFPRPVDRIVPQPYPYPYPVRPWYDHPWRGPWWSSAVRRESNAIRGATLSLSCNRVMGNAAHAISSK